MENKDVRHDDMLTGLINDTEALCRILEEMKAWSALTRAESLKRGLSDFLLYLQEAI